MDARISRVIPAESAGPESSPGWSGTSASPPLVAAEPSGPYNEESVLADFIFPGGQDENCWTFEQQALTSVAHIARTLRPCQAGGTKC